MSNKETCPDCDGSDMGERCRKCNASALANHATKDELRAELTEAKKTIATFEEDYAFMRETWEIDPNMFATKIREFKKLSEDFAAAKQANLRQRDMLNEILDMAISNRGIMDHEFVQLLASHRSEYPRKGQVVGSETWRLIDKAESLLIEQGVEP